MSYISSSPPIGILCVIGLYFIFLLFLIIVEIKNNNSKAKSFIWFFSSLIIPLVPFIYVIQYVIRFLKNKRKKNMRV